MISTARWRIAILSPSASIIEAMSLLFAVFMLSLAAAYYRDTRR